MYVDTCIVSPVFCKIDESQCSWKVYNILMFCVLDSSRYKIGYDLLFLYLWFFFFFKCNIIYCFLSCCWLILIKMDMAGNGWKEKQKWSAGFLESWSFKGQSTKNDLVCKRYKNHKKLGYIQYPANIFISEWISPLSNLLFFWLLCLSGVLLHSWFPQGKTQWGGEIGWLSRLEKLLMFLKLFK